MRILALLLLTACLYSAPFQSGYIVTSEFGSMEGKGGARRPEGHQGIDIIPTEWPFLIMPILDGIVVEIGHDTILGKYVIVEHHPQFHTLYAHGAKIFYTALEGCLVTTDTPIMVMGRTGFADGCHLHLETILNGVRVDPLEYLE